MAFNRDDECEVPGCFRQKDPPHLSCLVCARLFEVWKRTNPGGSFQDWKNGPGKIERDR